MGYCSRCGEISFGGKCRKCGGRAVASIANGLGSESQGSVVDRWQSQYASSILGSPEEKPQKTTSTPALLNRQVSKRASYSARSPSLAARRCCANCSKRLYVDTLAFVEGDATPQHYCADCYNRLYLKGSCRQCFKNVFRKDAHVEHNGKYWHHACFNCQGCRKALGDQPMVDLAGRPCCEPCLMAQEGQKHAKTASVHSARNLPSPDQVPPSSPTLSRYDSISSLSSFASSNASPFMRPRLDTRLFDSNDSNIMTSPIHESPRDIVSRATTPALSQASSGSVRSIDSVVSNVSYQPLGGDKPSRYNRQRTNSMPSLAQDILHGHQDSGEKKVPPPSLQRQRRQSTYFADKVQRCHECHDIANGITIRLPKADGFEIFHQSCLRCAGCKDIFTESDYIADGDAIYHPQCRLPAVGGVRCVQCFKGISGKFFKNNGKAYHPECFTCTSCVHVLDPGRPFYEIKGEAFCEPCTQNRTNRIQTAPVSPIEDIDATSKIFAKRTKALPQLGGTKTCPRCSKSVGFLEETPGPRASRWHKKCLTCGGCKKQMDSSATVLEGDRAEWIPFCRACRGFGSGGR